MTLKKKKRKKEKKERKKKNHTGNLHLPGAMKAQQSVLYLERERKEREPRETDKLGEMERESRGKRRGQEREGERRSRKNGLVPAHALDWKVPVTPDIFLASVFSRLFENEMINRTWVATVPLPSRFNVSGIFFP